MDCLRKVCGSDPLYEFQRDCKNSAECFLHRDAEGRIAIHQPASSHSRMNCASIGRTVGRGPANKMSINKWLTSDAGPKPSGITRINFLARPLALGATGCA